GFDCDASQISSAMFATIYDGCLYRANAAEGANFSFADIGPSCGNNPNPFWTITRLWESINDPLSQDTIIFAPDTNDIGIGSGNDFQKTFTGTLTPTQTSGIIVNGSVSFTAGLQMVEDFDGDGQLSGDGNGSVDYNTGAFTVNFITAPSLNTIVYAHFAERYNFGSEVILTSNSAGIPVHYTTLSAVYPGDTVYVQDPVQSMIALVATETSNGNSPSVLVARKAIDFSSDPEWWSLYQGAASVNCLEFSADGNHLFIGDGSNVKRVSGLSYLYSKDSISAVTTVTSIANFTPLEVTGISVDPVNPENIVVTLGGFSSSDHVYLINNAVSAGTNGGNKISKQSNLPLMPVYDAEIDVLDQNRVVIGTEYGVFACNDFSNSAPTWSDESDPTFAYVATYDVRQQRTPWNDADNHEVYYLGTFGRGMWQSGTFVGVPDQPAVTAHAFISDLLVFPNPMQGEGTISFKMEKAAIGNIRIFDLNGRLLKSIDKRSFKSGLNTINFNVEGLGTGTFFIAVETDTESKVTRFVNLR
ncbi:MAG: T9SS type A sorting domain-containing protein, partial [Flavobacteriales bacterium]